MRKSVDIDSAHSRAISREIGHRLRMVLKADPQTPASLSGRLDSLRLHDLEHELRSIKRGCGHSHLS